MDTSITTLGELKASNYENRSVHAELRENLINKLKSGDEVFEGIKGYQDTVIPQVETALLSHHNILFLGLRGQAKTKMARLMTGLLDEKIPVIATTPIPDDPFNPITPQGKKAKEEFGDDLPIRWLNREDRYHEKLATPDVTVADLIGDIDPIKAANLKLNLSDEEVIHYGMIPHSNKSIFVINELPDLQARIQVALFNILQEGDVQIRGFNIRLPLDMVFVFTANPEDYTNRGSIVTPLKDRIESQIITHYPNSLELAKEITIQESNLTATQKEDIICSDFIANLVEQIGFEARESEYVDQKSGVSARLSIAAFELLHSTAERRMIVNGEAKSHIRLSDLFGTLPAITGKIELVYEGEEEGMDNVALYLIGKAIRTQFEKYFPHPIDKKTKRDTEFYNGVISWFNNGNNIDILRDASFESYRTALLSVEGLEKLVVDQFPNVDEEQKLVLMEFVLHGLAEYSKITKQKLEHLISFKDVIADFNFDMDESDFN